jgi:hypothetical protein
VEHGSILDQANPLFEVSRKYLGPMNSEEAGELLNGFGRRMGLSFAPDAVVAAYGAVGGHPCLLRKLGSAVHSRLKDRGAIQVVSGVLMRQVFGHSKRDFFAHVHWIVDHLKRVAPDEERLLRDLAVSGPLAYEADWRDEEFRETFAHHLEQYGLVSFDGDVPTIALGLVSDALRRPVARATEQQILSIRNEMDLLEDALRSRLSVDIAFGRTAAEALEAVVLAIPKEAANRPKTREQLRALGRFGGIRPVLESLNWGDYALLIERFYDDIVWRGPAVERSQRVANVKEAIRVGHLARHNNRAEFREVVAVDGFEKTAAKVRAFREMIGG